MRRAVRLSTGLLAIWTIGAVPASAAGPSDLRASASGDTAKVVDQQGREVLTASFPGAASVKVQPFGKGIVKIAVTAPSSPTRATIATRASQRWMGFGERSDAVGRTSGTVTNEVSEGPYRDNREYDFASATVPAWALRRSRDATYFPMPWALSSAGYGVLVDNPETSRMIPTARGLGIEIDRAGMDLVVIGGRTTAEVVNRLTQGTGRQPAPPAPWVHGAWFQTGHENVVPDELEFVEALRKADAPVSAAETHLRYLPCQASDPIRPQERRRTADLHAQGLAVLGYANNELCGDIPLFERAAAAGALQRRVDGSPYVFTAYVGGRGPTPIAQFDFARPAGVQLWQSVLDQMADDGHDGLMEDYGEYTPPDSVSGDGILGTTMHNLYPVLYHKAGHEWQARRPGAQVRFIRSGWTGVHPYAQLVWGGDPTTGWGFDGLESQVKQALTMGLSGISLWGSDIGGFFTLSDEKLTPELLARWIQFGAVSGVMRTKATGIGSGQEERPQVWKQPTLGVWRRYSKLRTQLYPYLDAADREYRRTGMPLMRQMTLVDPGDARAASEERTFGFGPDFVVTPVVEPGARSVSMHLPAGRWVDFWDAVSYRASDGSLRLGRATPRRGQRTGVRVAAPLSELPMAVRAGAVVPLLPADVDTLADYGSRKGLVKYRDRKDRLELLAFPRGTTTSAFGAGGTIRSRETRSGWSLRVRGGGVERVRVQASLRTLTRSMGRPCAVRGASTWSYDRKTGVLRASLRGTSLTVERCRG